jgi:hypothetical protein
MSTNLHDQSDKSNGGGYLDRDGLLALGLDAGTAGRLLRDSALSGHGKRPVVEAEQLAELLAMLGCEGRDVP